MKKITYAEAVDILNDCVAVMISNDCITSPHIDDEEQNSISFFWEEEGYDFEAEFFESNNQKVMVDGSSMFLIDKKGDATEITILCKKNLD